MRTLREARSRGRAAGLATALLVVALAGCLPPRVRQLNALADDAIAARRYDQAIAHLSESLAIYPHQPKIAQQIDAAKIMLRQAQVYRIYELVDGPTRPVENFLEVWQIAAKLREVDVEQARVTSIHRDLRERFAKAEPRLRKRTEPHRYFLVLERMNRALPLPPVGRAEAEVAAILQEQHAAAERRADAAGQRGLALLHGAAAAVFGRGDSAPWARVRERQEALRRQLGIAVALEARSAPGGPGTPYLLGGLRRRLPRIFLEGERAPLQLALHAGRPVTEQQQSSSRQSAQCQVGTRREVNPECEPLQRSAEMAKRAYEGKLAALETARERCANASPSSTTSSCTSALSSAASDVDSDKRHYEELERKVGSCPTHIEQPVFKTFFYERFTISRRASLTGTVTLTRAGQPQRGRQAIGAAAATDTHGEGLGCANIAADPLELASLAELTTQAEEQLLDRSFAELHALRREAAQQQLVAGGSVEQRLDGLVRACFVDESYADVTRQLAAQLEAMWSADFDLPRRIAVQ